MYDYAYDMYGFLYDYTYTHTYTYVCGVFSSVSSIGSYFKFCCMASFCISGKIYSSLHGFKC